jgi:glycosyltransferase 2 family protein
MRLTTLQQIRASDQTSMKTLVIIGRAVVTALIAGYIYRRLDWSHLYETFLQTDPVKLGAAILLQGCGIALAVTRWRVLLSNLGILLSWPHTARLVLTGLFFNLFYIGSVGGDAARYVGALPHAAEGKARVAISLAQDRVIGLGGLLLTLTCFMAWHFPLLLADRAAHSFVIGVPVACAIFAALTAFLWNWSPPASTGGTPNTGLQWANFTGALRSSFPKRAFLPAMFLTLAIHLLAVLAGFLAAHAVGIAISFTEAGIALGITALALSLPITIAGLGVRDGMLIWMLAIFGFNVIGEAIAMSACLLGINLFWAFAGGVAFFWPSAHTQITKNIYS